MSLRLQQYSVLPGFNLALGYTLLYMGLIVLIPLSAAFIKTTDLTWSEFWAVVTAPRVLASYRLTFGASLLAALMYFIKNYSDWRYAKRKEKREAEQQQ